MSGITSFRPRINPMTGRPDPRLGQEQVPGTGNAVHPDPGGQRPMAPGLGLPRTGLPYAPSPGNGVNFNPQGIGFDHYHNLLSQTGFHAGMDPQQARQYSMQQWAMHAQRGTQGQMIQKMAQYYGQPQLQPTGQTQPQAAPGRTPTLPTTTTMSTAAPAGPPISASPIGGSNDPALTRRLLAQGMTPGSASDGQTITDLRGKAAPRPVPGQPAAPMVASATPTPAAMPDTGNRLLQNLQTLGSAQDLVKQQKAAGTIPPPPGTPPVAPAPAAPVTPSAPPVATGTSPAPSPDTPMTRADPTTVAKSNAITRQEQVRAARTTRDQALAKARQDLEDARPGIAKVMDRLGGVGLLAKEAAVKGAKAVADTTGAAVEGIGNAATDAYDNVVKTGSQAVRSAIVGDPDKAAAAQKVIDSAGQPQAPLVPRPPGMPKAPDFTSNAAQKGFFAADGDATAADADATLKAQPSKKPAPAADDDPDATAS